MDTRERPSRASLVTVSPETSITDAMRQLDQAGTGALVLCDREGRLCGLLTDGDIRRAFLRSIQFDRPCRDIASREPIVVEQGVSKQEMLRLMQKFDINHLPVVNASNVLLDLILRHDLVLDSMQNPSAVIMAGGYGKRLQPLTDDVPKPMLPVGDRPLMEITLERLRKSGFQRINVTTHHLAHRISEYFGDGSAFGVELNYVNETQPLGTVGGLKLMKDFQQPMLVINGDILTGMDFQHMLSYHLENRADMTVAVRKQEVEIRYGVIECDGPHVRALREKPKWEILVNAGIYILEPSVARFIPSGQKFDMTDLLQSLIEAGRPVVSFPIYEDWMDIGTHSDYAKAQTITSRAAAAPLPLS